MQALDLNEMEQQSSRDLQWALRAQEVQEHAGKFVAVHQQRVVGVGTDRAALVAEAAHKAQCCPENLVVVVVPSKDLSETPR